MVYIQIVINNLSSYFKYFIYLLRNVYNISEIQNIYRISNYIFSCSFAHSTLGRYKESKLAHLIGEEPNEQIDGQVVEETIRQVEMAPINRQPFSSHA